MWKTLYDIHPSLTWSQKSIEATLGQVEARVADRWPQRLSDEEKITWRASLGKQFRAMARHINNGKARSASWLGDVLGDGWKRPPQEAPKA
eukprot:11530869-Alexandrium_andersonii.AAC.1